ncbi:MAG TPA: hypothetical protein VK978_03075 [Candidatus Saccharimonadales bacterium]|nr:hypothetical protein [Candidatus Saccharimonadales bacterium]
MRSNTLTFSERVTHKVTLLIRLALFIVAIAALFNARWSVIFAAAGALVLSYVPQLLASQVKVQLPLQFQFVITLFLYATIFLGEVGDYYERYWWWDVVLHAGSAFAFGFVGFLSLYLLYSRHKLAASPFIVCVFAFSFGLAIGTIWEIFEFAMDQLFGLNMQKSGLRDTMWDLIVDAIGAGTASFIGYVYLRFKVRDPFDTFIAWFLRVNPQFGAQKPNKKLRKI